MNIESRRGGKRRIEKEEEMVLQWSVYDVNIVEHVLTTKTGNHIARQLLSSGIARHSKQFLCSVSLIRCWTFDVRCSTFIFEQNKFLIRSFFNTPILHYSTTPLLYDFGGEILPFPASQKMQMQMEDDLSAAAFDVKKQPVSGFVYSLCSSHFFRHEDQFRHNRLIPWGHIIDAANVTAGYDQKMNRGMRIDIAKHDHMLIFEQQFGGCFPVDDIAEDACGFHVVTTFPGSGGVIGVKKAAALRDGIVATGLSS
jgi:hypothetical protein